MMLRRGVWVYVVLTTLILAAVVSRAHQVSRRIAVDRSCTLCAPVPQWIAARTLARNTRLRVGDLRRPAGLPDGLLAALPDEDQWLGRHMMRDVKGNGVVREEDLADRPRIWVANGRVLVELPLHEDSVARTVRPRTPVALCTNGRNCVDGLQLEAVVCGEALGRDCTAHISMAEDLLDDVRAAIREETHLVGVPFSEGR